MLPPAALARDSTWGRVQAFPQGPPPGDSHHKLPNPLEPQHLRSGLPDLPIFRWRSHLGPHHPRHLSTSLLSFLALLSPARLAQFHRDGFRTLPDPYLQTLFLRHLCPPCKVPELRLPRCVLHSKTPGLTPQSRLPHTRFTTEVLPPPRFRHLLGKCRPNPRGALHLETPHSQL